MLTEHGVPFPSVTRSISAAFGWCNVHLFTVVKLGCKVRLFCACVVVVGEEELGGRLAAHATIRLHHHCPPPPWLFHVTVSLHLHYLAPCTTLHPALPCPLHPALHCTLHQAAHLDQFDRLLLVTLSVLVPMGLLGVGHAVAPCLVAHPWVRRGIEWCGKHWGFETAETSAGGPATSTAVLAGDHCKCVMPPVTSCAPGFGPQNIPAPPAVEALHAEVQGHSEAPEAEGSVQVSLDAVHSSPPQGPQGPVPGGASDCKFMARKIQTLMKWTCLVVMFLTYPTLSTEIVKSFRLVCHASACWP